MALSDILQGRKVPGPVPKEIQEYLMMKNYPNLSLIGIRNLSGRDHKVLSLLANTQNTIENAMHNRAAKQSERESRSKTIRRS
jgi:hypothetical protein